MFEVLVVLTWQALDAQLLHGYPVTPRELTKGTFIKFWHRRWGDIFIWAQTWWDAWTGTTDL